MCEVKSMVGYNGKAPERGRWVGRAEEWVWGCWDGARSTNGQDAIGRKEEKSGK